jgi:acyl CoA:acetate/3-ketoacid CoA transferase beta subunit
MNFFIFLYKYITRSKNMLSTLVGVCQAPGTNYNNANRAAAVLDLGGSITMLVLGILALTGTGNLSISMMGGALLTGGGGLTLLILAAKNMKRQDGKPTSPLPTTRNTTGAKAWHIDSD